MGSNIATCLIINSSYQIPARQPRASRSKRCQHGRVTRGSPGSRDSPIRKGLEINSRGRRHLTHGAPRAAPYQVPLFLLKAWSTSLRALPAFQSHVWKFKTSFCHAAAGRGDRGHLSGSFVYLKSDEGLFL